MLLGIWAFAPDDLAVELADYAFDALKLPLALVSVAS